jgi:hypothetical protein
MSAVNDLRSISGTELRARLLEHADLIVLCGTTQGEESSHDLLRGFASVLLTLRSLDLATSDEIKAIAEILSLGLQEAGVDSDRSRALLGSIG